MAFIAFDIWNFIIIEPMILKKIKILTLENGLLGDSCFFKK
jgi:hypothetical protein